MINLKEVFRKVTPPLVVDIYKWLKSSRITYSIANREAFLQLNKHAHGNEIVMRPGLRLKVLPESRVSFEYFCYADDECVQEMSCFLELARDKSSLLDVGALHGAFSLAFTGQQRSGRALAVEPSPAAFSCLLYNLHKNPGCQVRAREVALSDCEGTISMRLEWQHLVAAGSSETASDQCVNIESRTGDQLCAEEGFQPDLIKVDIEGYEFECFQGLNNTIDRLRPTIFLELHPEMLRAHGHSPADIAGFFRAKGYQFFDLSRRPIDYRVIEQATKIRRVFLQPKQP